MFGTLFKIILGWSLIADRYFVEALSFLKDDERLQYIANEYQNSLDDINKDSTARYIDRTSDRGKD